MIIMFRAPFSYPWWFFWPAQIISPVEWLRTAPALCM